MTAWWPGRAGLPSPLLMERSRLQALSSGDALCWEHVDVSITRLRGQRGHRALVRRPWSRREVMAVAGRGGQYLHGLADQAMTHVSACQARSGASCPLSPPAPS